MERNIIKNPKIRILLIFILICAAIGTILFTPYMYELRLQDTLSVNNPKTYLIDGTEYEVQIQNIDGDSQKTTFNVNGEEFTISPGDAYYLVDSTQVYLIETRQDDVDFNMKNKIPTPFIWFMIPFLIVWIMLFFVGFFGAMYWNYFIFRFRSKVKKIDKSVLKPLFFQNPIRIYVLAFKINWHVLSLGFRDKNKQEKIMDDFFNIKEIRKLNNMEINKGIDKMLDMHYFFSLLFVTLVYGLLIFMGIMFLLFGIPSS